MAEAHVDGTAGLTKEEQQRLIRAIESAIDVERKDQFRAWLSGPFRELLPHEFLVCMEMRASAPPQIKECLHYNPPHADALHLLCDPRHGLAVRLINAPAIAGRGSCTVDADTLSALPGLAGGGGLVRNAVMHHATLLSGASFSLILGNIPGEQLDRCHQLFKLVAMHLKMALSRTMPRDEAGAAPVLTPRELEILHWMDKGRTNREISEILGISVITLKGHVRKLYRKLNVQDRDEAVKRGLPAPAED